MNLENHMKESQVHGILAGKALINNGMLKRGQDSQMVLSLHSSPLKIDN